LNEIEAIYMGYGYEDVEGMKCFRTARLRRDTLKGNGPIPDSEERELRVRAHQRRVQEEIDEQRRR
jgi:hypothetical protein